MDVLLGVIVVGAVLVVIGYPIWRPTPQVLGGTRGPASELASLEERKESTYAAIRELGFDFHTDKLSEADYQIEIARLKAEAVGILRQVEELSSEPPTGPDSIEREIAAVRQALERSMPTAAPAAAPAHASAATPVAPGIVHFCTQCGRRAGAGDRFCAGCGAQLGTNQ